MALSVLVADPDDHAAVAFGSALRGTEFAFAGSVSHGKALLDALFTYSPWAVAIDLSLPDHPAAPNVGWASTAHQLLELAPQLRTIVTFKPELAGLVPGTLRAGVRSFAEKPYLRDEVLAALRHAARLGSERESSTFTCGDLKVDLAMRRVFLKENEILRVDASIGVQVGGQ